MAKRKRWLSAIAAIWPSIWEVSVSAQRWVATEAAWSANGLAVFIETGRRSRAGSRCGTLGTRSRMRVAKSVARKVTPEVVRRICRASSSIDRFVLAARMRS